MKLRQSWVDNEEWIVRWFATITAAAIIGITLTDGYLATAGVLLIFVSCGWSWAAFYWRRIAIEAEEHAWNDARRHIAQELRDEAGKDGNFGFWPGGAEAADYLERKLKND